MQKLLVICGPTATGKTSLGIALARKLNGEIVSADSRQVYKGMDIGTGKEWGKGVKIWGYDLVDPKKEYSVSKYLKFAEKTIGEIERRGKLPIIVGGTGLYIKAITGGIPTVNIPRNKNLRKSLETKSASELFETLASLDATKAGNMNVSDKNNPRRLIRAIEVAQYLVTKGASSVSGVKDKKSLENQDILFIGLEASKKAIDGKINNRVDARVRDGIKDEIKALLKKGVDWHDQSMFSLGYRQWRDYFEGEVEEEKIIEEWKKEERKYAKRQMTWFKKEKEINWFDVNSSEFPNNVEKLVERWHNGL